MVREDYVKSTSLAVIEHRVHVTYLTQCPAIWVEDGRSFCTICKTFHSTSQAFERQTNSSVTRKPRFALVHTVQTVE